MKLKKIAQKETTSRETFTLKTSTVEKFKLYKEYYFNSYGDKIENSELLEAILVDFMEADKEFLKFTKTAKGLKAGKAIQEESKHEEILPEVAQPTTYDNSSF